MHQDTAGRINMTKKQAVFIRVPGIKAYSDEMKAKMAESVRSALQSQFEDKEIIVLIFNDDIHFCNEGEIRDMIEQLENSIN